MSALPTTWLTRALISPQTVVARGIKDNYVWHQLVWQAFPGLNGQAREFLSRLDDKPGGTQILLVSTHEPQRPGWLGKGDAWETKVIPPGYFLPRRFRFQLRANPTVKRVVRDAGGARKKNGRREPVFGEEALRAWLQRKGEAGGFLVPADSVLEIGEQAQHFARRGARPAQGVHHTVDFSGFIEITDRDQFLQSTFLKGTGSAKAFGFGLWVLAPA